MIEISDMSKSKNVLYRALRKYPVISSTNYSLLHSGERSNDYFDIDRLTGHLEEQREIINLLTNLARKNIESGMDFNKIAVLQKSSGPTGVLPLASSVSQSLERDFVTLRIGNNFRLLINKVKGWISGKEQYPINPEDKILIIDDVITTGRSQLKAIDLIEKFGASVSGIIVAYTRKEEEVKKIKETKNINFISSIFTRNELIALGYVEPDQMELFYSDFVSLMSDRIRIFEGESKARAFEEKVNSNLEHLVNNALKEDGIAPNDKIIRAYKNMYLNEIMGTTQE